MNRIKLYKSSLLILLSVLMTVCSSTVDAQAILLSDEDEVVIKNVEYFLDSEGQFTIEDVRAEDSSIKFQLAGEDFLIDNNAEAYWTKFSLQNTTNEAQEWIIDYNFWSVVDFYYEREDDLIKTRTGHMVPYKQKDFPFADRNYILIDLDAGETIACYSRLNQSFNGEYKPINLDLRIGKRQKIESFAWRSISISLLFIGAFLVMFIYNFFIYFSTKDKSYRFYLVTIVIQICIVTALSGLFFDIFPDFENAPVWVRNFIIIEPTLVSISVLFFIKDFLRLEDRHPKWALAIKIDIALLFLFLIIFVFSYKAYFGLILFNTFPFMVLLFGPAIVSYREKFPGAFFIILGHVFWFVGGIGGMMGLIHPAARQIDFFANHSIFLGASLELVLFSLALANTINLLKRENEEKQEKLILQLQENATLQDKVNRELEEKVLERTKEIEKQRKDIEHEKERSDTLLLNILPREVADELKNDGQATPKHFDEVSILFADITSFSVMARKISATDLVHDLDAIFSAFDEMIERNNLEKIKTIGDAYLCVGGLTGEQENHPHDSVKTAIEMMDFIEEWKKGNHVLTGENLNLRIGIHSGPVSAGVVGKTKFQFDIWGDSVNLASRLESNSKPGQINISREVYNHVKDRYNCKYRGTFPVKNMGEVDMFFVEY